MFLKRPIFLFIFFASFAFISLGYGQDFSNKGKEFWVGYGNHVSMFNTNGTPNSTTGGNQNMVLYFTSDQNAVVTVDIPAINWTKTYNVVANQVTQSDIIPKTGTDDARITKEGKSNKGIHITSNVGVIAYAHIYNASISGASLLFPVNTLSREYYSINYTQVSNSAFSYCYAYAIATEDSTNIEIILSANTSDGHIKGDTIKVVLNKGEIYNIFGRLNTTSNPFRGEDLTGTKFRSIATSTSTCKRIAVFSGSGKLSLNCNANSAGSSDNYMQQAFPATAWGKKYLTAPTQSMPNNFYRIVVSKPSTKVYVNGGLLSSALLINNFYYEYSSAVPGLIVADNPIMVSQYITTANSCGNTAIGTNGDPEMIYLSPMEQTINKVTINSTPFAKILYHYTNIIVHKNGVKSLLIDGLPTAGLTIHPQDTNYRYFQVPLLAGSHTIQSDSGFNAIAYGYGGAESYGYNAGTNVRDLDQTLSTSNQYATVNAPATCKGTPFNVSITLTYIPLSVKWTIPGFPAIPQDNSPKYDTTFINPATGKTIYKYSLKTPYTYAIPGTYNIQVLVNNPTSDGCSGEQQLDFDLQVYENQKANNTIFSTNCLSDSLVLSNAKSNLNSRPVAFYNWDFGDGKFIQTKDSIFKFKVDTAGKYFIRYYTINELGCISDTLTSAAILIDSLPKFNYSLSPVTCINKDIIFTDASTPRGNSSLVSWIWNYGDGSKLDTNASNISKVHQYTNLTTYTTYLSLITANGCKVTDSISFVNHANPVVKFLMPKICLPDGKGIFNDASTIVDNTESEFKYTWNFGDPSASPSNLNIVVNNKMPSHKYASTGPFNVKLIVESKFGCQDSLSQDLVDVYAQPKVAFAVSPEVCLRDTTFFEDQIDGKGKLMKSWNWTFSDGTNSFDQNPKLAFPLSKTYTATLFGFSTDGCTSDTVQKSFTVHPLPTADFKLMSTSCEKDAIKFLQKSLPSVGYLTRWNWTFGGNTALDYTDSTAPVYINFPSWGNQTIKLMVENSKGCKSDTIVKTQYIHPKPKVGYIIPEVCLDDAFAIFNDTTKIDDNSNNKFDYLWYFNITPPPGKKLPTIPTSQLTIPNPKIKYNDFANYLVALRVTQRETGCMDSLASAFTVNGSTPKAQFAVLKDNLLCSNESVQIKDSSWVNFGTIGKLVINWGDGLADSTVDDPAINRIYQHYYKNINAPNNLKLNYTIKIKASSGGVCVKDTTNAIKILPPPEFPIVSTAKNYLCISDSLVLHTVSKGGLPPFINVWTSENTNATIKDSTIYGKINGVANASLVVTDSKNCIFPYKDILLTKSMNVLDIPIPTIVAVDTIICNGNSIKLVGGGVGAVSYTWYRNDTLLNTTLVDNLFVNIPGFYKLTINDGSCNSLKTNAQKISPLDIKQFDFSYNPLICINAPLIIKTSAQDQPHVYYKWDFGDGTSFGKANPVSHKFRVRGEYYIRMNVTNDYCPTFNYQLVGSKVIVQPALKAASYIFYILANTPYVINTKIDSGYNVYNWQPTLYLSPTAPQAFPTFLGSNSTDYLLTRTDTATNCSVTDEYQIVVSTRVFVTIPNAFTPNNDGLNDVLKVEYGAGVSGDFKLMIYNRWGKLMFQTTDINKGWNGRDANGVLQEMDSYNYFMEYNYIDPVTKESMNPKSTGSIILIRQ